MSGLWHTNNKNISIVHGPIPFIDESFFSLDDNNFKDFKKELESLDTDNLTPVEALVKLSELKKKITDND